MKKRIVILLSVVALMVGMLAVMALPAFAVGGGHFVTIPEGPHAGSVVSGEGISGLGGHGCGPFGCHGTF